MENNWSIREQENCTFLKDGVYTLQSAQQSDDQTEYIFVFLNSSGEEVTLVLRRRSELLDFSDDDTSEEFNKSPFMAENYDNESGEWYFDYFRIETNGDHNTLVCCLRSK